MADDFHQLSVQDRREALAPLYEAVRPPYRPDPHRGPGRRRETIVEEETKTDISKPPSLSQLERRNFDYTALQKTMAQLDDVVRMNRRKLQTPNLAGLSSNTQTVPK